MSTIAEPAKTGEDKLASASRSLAVNVADNVLSYQTDENGKRQPLMMDSETHATYRGLLNLCLEVKDHNNPRTKTTAEQATRFSILKRMWTDDGGMLELSEPDKECIRDAAAFALGPMAFGLLKERIDW